MKGVLNALPKNAELHVICDSAEEYSGQILELYLRMRVRVKEFKRQCVAITFAEDHMFPPLQLADIVAYCCRQREQLDEDQRPGVVNYILDKMESSGTATAYLTYTANAAGLGDGILGHK
jgi:hypothetical protein